MANISDFMSRDHKACDESFARAEEAASAGDWQAATSAFELFHRAMERHLAMEEEVLFPAFEEDTGMSGGPTDMMRVEHEQMRSLFGEMAAAVAAHDANQYLGLSDTLLVLMQQHNMKEEGMLYPMMDQVLDPRSSELIGRCNALEAA
jgi:iron-sulfur cluster repair protein YtfE (RIC family)